MEFEDMDINRIQDDYKREAPIKKPDPVTGNQLDHASSAEPNDLTETQVKDNCIQFLKDYHHDMVAMIKKHQYDSYIIGVTHKNKELGSVLLTRQFLSFEAVKNNVKTVDFMITFSEPPVIKYKGQEASIDQIIKTYYMIKDYLTNKTYQTNHFSGTKK